MRSRSHEFLWAFIFGRKTPRLNVKAPYRYPPASMATRATRRPAGEFLHAAFTETARRFHASRIGMANHRSTAQRVGRAYAA
jgi:hypothetical protein